MMQTHVHADRKSVAVLPVGVLTAFFVLVLPGLALVAGCAAPAHTVRESSEVDSLRVINRRLAGEIKVLSDSLGLLLGVESGQYFRDYRSLQEQIAKLQYRLAECEDGGHVIGTELVDNLFAPASANLTEAGKLRIDEMVAAFGETLPPGELRVHGHADTSRPGSSLAQQFPTNWELSAARATAVTRYLVEKFGVAPNRIAAVSFGDARPVESNRTAEGRKRNRRIELVVL